MSDGSAILLTIASTAVSSAATWYVSRRYYCKAGADSTAALHPLLQAVRAIGRMLEQANLGKLTYDEAGNITGIVITATGHIQLSGIRASGFATCTPPPQYDRQHEQPPSPEPEGDHA